MIGPMAVLLLSGLLSATDPAASPEPRVEASDRESNAVLRDGCRRSPTLRALVDSIDASAWFVFVQEGACPAGSDTVGCLLHTVGRYHGAPYLRIRIAARGRNRDRVIATLAHELQHAWEAISDPSVVDSESLSAMFRRIGFESLRTGSTTVLETAEADRVGTVVLHELDADNVQRR